MPRVGSPAQSGARGKSMQWSKSLEGGVGDAQGGARDLKIAQGGAPQAGVAFWVMDCGQCDGR